MNEIQTTYTGTANSPTIATLLINAAGQAYNAATQAFEAINPANIAHYNAAPATLALGTAEYLASMPSGLPAGKYSFRQYVQAGANLAVSDIAPAEVVSTGSILWNGTNEVTELSGVNLNLAQAIPPTGNTAQTTGDALNAARAGAFGKEVISGTTLTLYAADGATPVRVFTLDSATAPTQKV